MGIQAGESNTGNNNALGTPAYTSPEVFTGNGYDGRLADAWSLGIVLYVRKLFDQEVRIWPS